MFELHEGVEEHLLSVVQNAFSRINDVNIDEFLLIFRFEDLVFERKRLQNAFVEFGVLLFYLIAVLFVFQIYILLLLLISIKIQIRNSGHTRLLFGYFLGDYVDDATLVVVLDCILYEVEQYKLYVLPICQYFGILYFFLGNDYCQILVFDLLGALPEEPVE